MSFIFMKCYRLSNLRFPWTKIPSDIRLQLEYDWIEIFRNGEERALDYLSKMNVKYETCSPHLQDFLTVEVPNALKMLSNTRFMIAMKG